MLRANRAVAGGRGLTLLGLALLAQTLAAPTVGWTGPQTAAEAAAGEMVAAETGAPPLDGRPFFWALSVADIERSAVWYRRVMGFTEARQIDLPERGVRVRLLRSDHAFLELVEHRTARPLSEIAADIERTHQVHGVFKLGLLVDNLTETVDRLGALGVPLRGKVFTEPDGSFRSAQIEDPDGNIIQLFERLED